MWMIENGMKKEKVIHSTISNVLEEDKTYEYIEDNTYKYIEEKAIHSCRLVLNLNCGGVSLLPFPSYQGNQDLWKGSAPSKEGMLFSTVQT